MKYEDIYIKDYDRVIELESGLSAYFRFYDEERPHQSLATGPPARSIEAGDEGKTLNKCRWPEWSTRWVH